MTGHQNNPANGLTIKGDPTVAVNLEALAKAVGFQNVVVVDPFDIETTKAAVKAELEKKEPSLIISRRPCALLKTVKHEAPVNLNVGCPALSQTKRENGKYLAVIDNTQCVGCGVCASACKFGAIEKGGND